MMLPARYGKTWARAMMIEAMLAAGKKVAFMSPLTDGIEPTMMIIDEMTLATAHAAHATELLGSALDRADVKRVRRARYYRRYNRKKGK